MTYVGVIFATDVGKQLINKALIHVLTSEALIFGRIDAIYIN